MSDVRLSLCIPTMNRHRFIAETLDSIVDQLTPDSPIEIVIVDGNHDDLTRQVVDRYIATGAPIRWFGTAGGNTPSNEGFDRDLDRAVTEARGEWCWLFTDDDTLIPGAIAAVLAELADGAPELLVVDAEVRDVALDRRFEPRRLAFAGRRDYGPGAGDALMTDIADALTFVGVVIIRRATWEARDRASYYGSGFLHVCVIFQPPHLASARALGQPLVRIRMGNAAWSGRAFDIWLHRWPALIWGFPGFGDAARAAVVAREPWRDWRQVMTYRAYGSFNRANRAALTPAAASPRARRRLGLMAALPGSLAFWAVTAWLARSPSRDGSVAYNLSVTSPYAGPVGRWVKRSIERLYRR